MLQCAWTTVDESDGMSSMRTVSKDLSVEYSRIGARIDHPLTPCFWLGQAPEFLSSRLALACERILVVFLDVCDACVISLSGVVFVSWRFALDFDIHR
mgnify:CR=1 FL=1